MTKKNKQKHTRPCGDENIRPGLITPRDRIYSPSMVKGLKGKKKR